jgi:hypothetical protein
MEETRIQLNKTKEGEFHMGQRLKSLTEKAMAIKGYRFQRFVLEDLVDCGAIDNASTFYFNLKASEVSTVFIKAYKNLYGIHPSEWFDGM